MGKLETNFKAAFDAESYLGSEDKLISEKAFSEKAVSNKDVSQEEDILQKEVTSFD